MPSADAAPIRAHEDAALFRAAVTFTAAQTAFDPRLIDKDYFGSVSEGLDFSVPMSVDARPAERSRSAKPARDALDRLASVLGVVAVTENVRGGNTSMQHLAGLSYTSLLDSHAEPIRVEIGLRGAARSHGGEDTPRPDRARPASSAAAGGLCRVRP